MMATFRRSNNSPKPTRIVATTNEDFIDEQFELPPPKVPIKSILLAIFLFLLGSILITLGALLVSGMIGPSSGQTDPRATPLLILGTLLFIPGSYHVRLAYLAYKGVDGYDYSQIPDLDD